MKRFWQFLAVLLLAAMTLLAGSFHILCDARIVECVPCQQSSSNDDHDSCPACSLSVSIAKTSIAPVKFVMPAMQVLVMDDTFVITPFPALLEGAVFVGRPEFASQQAKQHLLDLVQSIPIRGPSLTA